MMEQLFEGDGQLVLNVKQRLAFRNDQSFGKIHTIVHLKLDSILKKFFSQIILQVFQTRKQRKQFAKIRFASSSHSQKTIAFMCILRNTSLRSKIFSAGPVGKTNVNLHGILFMCSFILILSSRRRRQSGTAPPHFHKNRK